MKLLPLSSKSCMLIERCEVMRKKAHVYLARYLMDQLDWEEFEQYKKAFYIGSVLPDVKPTFLYRRHEFEGCFDHMLRMMDKLAKKHTSEKVKMNSYCMLMGEISHYLADFFTYPHNKEFRDGFAAHCHYEKFLTQRLKEYVKSDEAIDVKNHVLALGTREEIEAYVKKEHRAYRREGMGLQNDVTYIVKVSYLVIEALIHMFTKTRMQMIAGAQA